MLSAAINDLRVGIGNWRLWSLMGLQDIRQRYRGSALGPIWMVGNMVVIVIGLGFLYSNVFKTSASEYFLFLAASITVWNFIALVITEACYAFLASSGILKQMKVPLSTFVARVLWRNVIVMAHSLVVYLCVAVYFNALLHVETLYFLVGFPLLMVNLGWIALAVAMLAARFRDMLQVVTYVLQFMVFFTPVYWMPRVINLKSPFLTYNPLYHLLEVVRQPLLGHAPSSETLLVTFGLAVLGWAITLVVFARQRRDVIFWI